MGALLSIGATGSIGRHVVRQALEEGYEVRALSRDPRGLPDAVEVIQGDLTRPETLGGALRDVSSIVFTHGGPAEAVGYGGVRNVLAALDGRPARIALMTAIAVTDRKGGHDWKRRGERLVRASGNAFTIVRPGWFDYNDADQRKLVMLQGDRRQSGSPRDGVIARDQLARVLLGSLRSDAAAFKTFELVAERGTEQADLDTVFAPLAGDTGLDGALDAHNMPLEREPEAIRADLDRIRQLSPETS